MDATSLQTPLQLVSAMDTSMDIDMDIDLGLMPEPEPIELEPAAPAPATEDTAALFTTEEAVFEKVHIRGLDDLATDNVRGFALEHFGEEEPSRVEWIDDTSANIVYSSPEVGLRALAALTQPSLDEDVSMLPSLRLRTAKTLSTHPDSVLQVRSAVLADRKRRRAHEASRFYLMHPEHDPRERMRREFSERRSRDGSQDYNRRRFDDREHRRRRKDGGGFKASMYDDIVQDSDRETDDQVMSNGDSVGGRRDRGRRRNYELFPSESDRPGRLRSASPGGEEPDREGSGSRRRFRDRSPRTNRDRDVFVRKNSGKELFPSGATSSDEGSSRRELLPNKTASSFLKKELFPNKTTNSNHRRSDAFDAADEAAELFSRRISIPLVDGASDIPPAAKDNVELFPDARDSNGKYENGVNIRGSSSASADQGLSILGASSSQGGGISIKGAASIRELFPTKPTGNRGKELFSDRLDGRGGRRKRAEDMFS